MTETKKEMEMDLLIWMHQISNDADKKWRTLHQKEFPLFIKLKMWPPKMIRRFAKVVIHHSFEYTERVHNLIEQKASNLLTITSNTLHVTKLDSREYLLYSAILLLRYKLMSRDPSCLVKINRDSLKTKICTWLIESLSHTTDIHFLMFYHAYVSTVVMDMEFTELNEWLHNMTIVIHHSSVPFSERLRMTRDIYHRYSEFISDMDDFDQETLISTTVPTHLTPNPPPTPVPHTIPTPPPTTTTTMDEFKYLEKHPKLFFLDPLNQTDTTNTVTASMNKTHQQWLIQSMVETLILRHSPKDIKTHLEWLVRAFPHPLVVPLTNTKQVWTPETCQTLFNRHQQTSLSTPPKLIHLFRLFVIIFVGGQTHEDYEQMMQMSTKMWCEILRFFSERHPLILSILCQLLHLSSITTVSQLRRSLIVFLHMLLPKEEV